MLFAPDQNSEVLHDYVSTGHSLRQHPVSLIRHKLEAMNVQTAQSLWQCENSAYVNVIGIVVGRQSPGTASGVMFMTLEDETGLVNLVVWSKIMERYRCLLLTSNLLLVKGKVQQADGVLHIISESFDDVSAMLAGLETKSRDFH